MDKVKLYVGTKHTLPSGQPQDEMRPVSFEGMQLATVTEYNGSNDSRGTTEELYKTADGRFVVFVQDWTRWQDETSYYYLVEAKAEDLDVGGRFEMLGREAGLARPLTLDEALE